MLDRSVTGARTGPIGSEPPEIGDRVRAVEAVVAAALAAFQAPDWDVAIALTDADSIESLRRNYLDEKARRFAFPPRQSWEPADSFLEEIEEFLATARSGLDRIVIGSVAILADTVAVLVRTLNVAYSQPLAPLGMVAGPGDGRGDWRLDAQNGWLGLADRIVR